MSSAKLKNLMSDTQLSGNQESSRTLTLVVAVLGPQRCSRLLLEHCALYASTPSMKAQIRVTFEASLFMKKRQPIPLIFSKLKSGEPGSLVEKVVYQNSLFLSSKRGVSVCCSTVAVVFKNMESSNLKLPRSQGAPEWGQWQGWQCRDYQENQTEGTLCHCVDF